MKTFSYIAHVEFHDLVRRDATRRGRRRPSATGARLSIHRLAARSHVCAEWLVYLGLRCAPAVIDLTARDALARAATATT